MCLKGETNIRLGALSACALKVRLTSFRSTFSMCLKDETNLRLGTLSACALKVRLTSD